jgi:hypothetical protein
VLVLELLLIMSLLIAAAVLLGALSTGDPMGALRSMGEWLTVTLQDAWPVGTA